MELLCYQHGNLCEPDIISTFKQMGHRVECITEEIYQKEISPKQCIDLVSHKLLERSYDFVFTINYYPAISEVCHIFKLLYVSWIVTCPVFELYSDAVKRGCNRIFLFDHAMYQEFHPHNPASIFYLPMGTNVSHMQQICSEITEADREQFSSTISFVGSLYSEKCPYNQVSGLPERLRGYLNGLIEAQVLVYGQSFLEECIPAGMAETFMQYDPRFYRFPELAEQNYRAVLAYAYLGAKASELERIRLLGALSQRYPVDLYTGSDTSVLPMIQSRGLAKTASEMPKIFCLSEINLNITAKSIRTGISLRVWDVLACGGFLITNYQKELEQYFDLGVDLVCYSSRQELLELTAYYLDHPQERRQIAARGCEKVRSKHSYFNRIQTLLDLL